MGEARGVFWQSMDSAGTPGVRRRMTQWIMVAAWIAAIAGLTIMDLNHSPDGGHTPWGCTAGIMTAFVHGAWITLDCHIRDRRVGAWRFAAFFLGPLAIWLYLVSCQS